MDLKSVRLSLLARVVLSMGMTVFGVSEVFAKTPKSQTENKSTSVKKNATKGKVESVKSKAKGGKPEVQKHAQSKHSVANKKRNAHDKNETITVTKKKVGKHTEYTETVVTYEDEDVPSKTKRGKHEQTKHEQIKHQQTKRAAVRVAPIAVYKTAPVAAAPKVKSVLMIESESGKRFEKISYESAPDVIAIPPSVRDRYERQADTQMSGAIGVSAASVMIQDLTTGEVLFTKNADRSVPIASVTKLMTAILIAEANQPLDEVLEVTRAEMVYPRSRLKVGTRLTRGQLIHLMVMSSENHAAQTLASNYPGGLHAFISAMNAKAQLLGMTHTRFADPTGLSSANRSSPSDLVKLIATAYQYSLIREFSTSPQAYVEVLGKEQHFMNSNALVRDPQPGWQIGLSKTGYIREAGRCLVMHVMMRGRPYAVVLLDSADKSARVEDALKVKDWLEVAPTLAKK